MEKREMSLLLNNRVESQIHLSIICHSWTNKILLFYACSFSFCWIPYGTSSSVLLTVCVKRDGAVARDTATMYQHIYIFYHGYIYVYSVYSLCQSEWYSIYPLESYAYNIHDRRFSGQCKYQHNVERYSACGEMKYEKIKMKNQWQ